MHLSNWLRKLKYPKNRKPKRHRRARHVEPLEERLLLAAAILDVDGNGQSHPLTDGMLLIRHFAGFSGASLTSDAHDPEGERTDATEIADFLDAGGSRLDFDNDGRLLPLTDGIFAIRYLAGFTGHALTSDLHTPTNFAVDVVSQEFSEFVAGANDEPVIESVPEQSVTPGMTLTLPVRATDIDDPVSDISLSLQPGSPEDATISSTTGELRWSPTSEDVGTNEIVVQATDAAGATVSESIFVHVEASVSDDSSSGATRDPAETQEFRVNTYTRESQVADKSVNQTTATLPGGGFVTVWQSARQDGSGWGVYGQRFNADGSKAGPEFRVNQTTRRSQRAAAIDVAPNGTFAVAWQSDIQDGHSTGIVARYFSALAEPLTDEFIVNETTRGQQANPDLAFLDDGSLAIVWAGKGIKDTSGVFARKFNEFGEPLTPEFRVNSFYKGEQTDPTIVSDTAGGMWVVWSGRGTTDGTGIHAKRLDSAGNVVVDEFQVNQHKQLQQSHPTVAIKDDRLLIAWQSFKRDGSSWGVYARLFDATGNPQTDEFRANDYTRRSQYYPSVNFLNDGQFVITWAGRGENENHGVFAQQFDADANPLLDEAFIVNTTTDKWQSRPSVVANDPGYLVTWTGKGVGDAPGVFARQINVDGACGIAADNWAVEEFGGTTTPGSVSFSNCTATLTEGDSFLVQMATSFVVPEDPATIRLTYEDLSFDTTNTNFVNDAFEVAMTDADGNPLVTPFAAGRDAFFNITESRDSISGPQASRDNGSLTLDISTLLPGEFAHLVIRLVNNDDDLTTSVVITGIEVDAEFAPEEVLSTTRDAAPSSQRNSLSRTPNGPVDAVVSQHGFPTLMVRAPVNRARVGSQIVLSGAASASDDLTEHRANVIEYVAINGRPVDSLDAAGRFFFCRKRATW